MNINKCNLCKHKSEVGVYNFQMCITCSDNPFVIDDRFDAKEVEIVPQAAGELWKCGAIYCHTYSEGYGASENREIILIDDYKTSIDTGNVIHGKNGWTRLFPEVEDDSVETIEIEDVLWNTNDECTYPYQERSGYDWDELLNTKPMKLICVIPKEG